MKSLILRAIPEFSATYKEAPNRFGQNIQAANCMSALMEVPA
jgi:hypothetical protein